MERRQFLIKGLKASIVLATATELTIEGPDIATLAQTRKRRSPVKPTPRNYIETESGDPDLPEEILNISVPLIERLYGGLLLRGVRKNPESMALKTLEVAKSYLGVNRAERPEQIEKFLNLFGLHLRYGDGTVVPYCASGLSYVACQAYCILDPAEEVDPNDPDATYRRVLPDINKYYFKPSPACKIMMQDANRHNRWLAQSNIGSALVKPGWLVFFDWKRRGNPRHVGIVDRIENNELHTVEFNTSSSGAGNQSNGGAVAQKVRSFQYVLGYIKTY